jgi:hypothetical protein
MNERPKITVFESHENGGQIPSFHEEAGHGVARLIVGSAAVITLAWVAFLGFLTWLLGRSTGLW